MKEYQQICVSGFILNDKNEVLLVKRSENDDFLPGLWELPGGGTDFAEHPLKALQREIKEEVGLDIAVGKPLHVDDYFMKSPDAKKHRVEIFFLCKANSFEVKLSNEHSEFVWLSKEKLNQLEMTDYIKTVVETCFKNF